MPYIIKSHKTNRTLFVAEIDVDNLSESERKGCATILASTNGANLSDADLSGANLRGADLSDANLRGADLSDAYLRGANLRRANLSDADLSGANLGDADLSGANLRRANLSDADLSGACGIISFGPIGSELRIGYAVAHIDGPRIQLGCFWETLDKTCAAIIQKYGEASSYEALVRGACAALEEK